MIIRAWFLQSSVGKSGQTEGQWLQLQQMCTYIVQCLLLVEFTNVIMTVYIHH